jgi:hypothetical protein
MVAGVEFQFDKPIAYNGFRTFCDNRIKQIINKTREELEFQIFDFKAGEIITKQVNIVNGQAVQTESRKDDRNGTKFMKISKSNYDRAVDEEGETHYYFKRNQPDAMSIVDIYKAIKKIGKDSPGTLLELSFFSHGWMGGPILVNSYDYTDMSVISSYLRNVRLPDDMDPRSNKDFIPPNMSTEDLSNFQKSFSPNGYTWIWGCAFPRIVNQILNKIENNQKYKPAGVDDDTLLKFSNISEEEYNVIKGYLINVFSPFPNRRNFELKFRYLRYFFCVLTISSYCHSIAKASKVKAYGPVTGTFTGPETGNFALMRVDPIFSRHLKFYESYLGIKFDPEGRKYGIHLPDFECAIPMEPLEL